MSEIPGRAATEPEAPASPEERARIASPLLFGSGLCALVYQIAWLREFRLVFGSSTGASAAVLAIFIGGLGAGGLLIGRRADRHPRPFLLYARLETLIAISTAATPFLLELVRAIYVALGGTLALGSLGGTLLRLLLAALVLAAPTCLMGGTLPAAARAVATPDDQGRRSVALLYGVNTLGAVTGSFVGTFFMLEVFGTRRTLWLGTLLNLLVAIVARQVAGRLPAEPERSEAGSIETAGSAPAAFVLPAAAVVGFAFFLMELVWYRMLGPILGGTVYTFGLVLTVALLGIGVGGVACSILRPNRPATAAGFAATCLLEAVLIALPYALGDRLAILALALRSLGSLSVFWGQVLGWTLVCSIVVLPAALLAGYQFPLLIGLLGRGRRAVGRQTGLTYASNTLGAIVGSLAGGFGLVPLLSAPGAWRAAAVCLVVLGGVAVGLAPAPFRWRRVLLPAGLATGALLLLAAAGPTAAWRHSGIGAGRARPLISTLNGLRAWLRTERRLVLWQADGVESSVALEALGPGVAFIINGKNDSNAVTDAPTTIMSGMIGAVLHPDPRRSLVIGLGTGSTAGWLAAIPQMERTDVIELEPVVQRVARDCAPANQGAMSNPKVHVTLGDAREVLLTSRQTYDLIASEPSNPYRAGVASLFTREYYTAVARHLRDGGLFLQWVQAYEVDARTVKTIYATLHAVFPEIETWRVGRTDLLLVASRTPIVHDVARLRARLDQEPYRTAALRAWRVEDLEGFLAFFVARSSLASAVARSERSALNTDDLNLVEFGFARTVGQPGAFGVNDVRDAALTRGEDRPDTTGGEVDWPRFEDERVELYADYGDSPLARSRLTAEQRRLASAFDLFKSGDDPGALAAWRSLGRAPRNPAERTLAASALAHLGDEAALGYIEEIGQREPLLSASLLAVLRAAQGRAPDAVAALETVFTGYRTDPWVGPQAAADLALAADLAGRSPAFARRLFEALKAPFALRGFDEERRNVLVATLPQVGFGRECRGVFEPVEPDVPWDDSWLSLRVRCYAAAGDARLEVAAADLAAYRAARPREFSAALQPDRPPGR